MVEEPRAAPASEDWPLAGWLAGRRTLAGSIAARLQWQPALTSGRAGLAMLRPALRAFVPAIPIARLFEPVAGPLQRREISWSAVERFWWRRQAPELALLGGRRTRWQITPVPLQRKQELAAPAPEPVEADLAPEALLDEAVALELREETPDAGMLEFPAEHAASTGAPATGEQPLSPPSQAGPLAAIGRALSTIMRRLVPTMEHAPVAGSRRTRTLLETAGGEAQQELLAAPGAEAEGPGQAVPAAGPAQPAILGGQGAPGLAPGAAIARQAAPAGPALTVPLEQSAAGPATLSAARTVEPLESAPMTVREGAPAVSSQEGEPAGLPSPSLEAGQAAPGGGMATLRLRALELWHRVVPRRAAPAGQPTALPVERVAEPPALPADRADQGDVELAGRAAKPASPVVERTLPETVAMPATAPVTALTPAGPVMPEAQPDVVTRTPAAGDAGGAVEAPGSSTPLGLSGPQDQQRVSAIPAAPPEAPGPAFQPWRPGEPRPAPADLIAPLAAGVLQRRGAETSGESGPAAVGPEPAAEGAAGAPGWPPAQPSDPWSRRAVPPAAPPAPGATSQERPAWAVSLSEQLRRLQRSTHAEPESSIQPEARQGAMPSTGQATVQPAPAEPRQVQRAGSAGAPGPAARSGLPAAPLASLEPAAGVAGAPAAPPQSAHLQQTVAPAPSAPPESAGQGPAIARSGPGSTSPAPDAVEESARQESRLAGAADTSALDAPVELVAFPSLAEWLSARSRGFATRIMQRSLAMPLANAAGWAEEHAAAAGGLAAEVMSQVSSSPAPGSALLSGASETGELRRAPDVGSAALPPESTSGVPAEPGVEAEPVSPYAAYLEALRASGMPPGASGSPRSEAPSWGSAAGPFRLSEGRSAPGGAPGQSRPGAPSGIYRAAGLGPFGTPGAPLDVQRSAAGAAAGTQEPEPPPEGSAPDQDELAQVLRNLPPAMAAAAMAKGVLAPQPGTPSRTATGAVEPAPAPSWQPLARVQAPAPVARAPVVAAAGVEEAEARHLFAGDWETFEAGSTASWETPAGLPHALQRAVEPQPSEGSGAPGIAGEHGPTAPGQAQAAELDRLADEVFELLRWRLAAERERMMR